MTEARARTSALVSTTAAGGTVPIRLARLHALVLERAPVLQAAA